MSHISGGGVRRVVKPRHRYMASRKEQEDTRSALLSKMDAFYMDASKRLVVRARPVTLARFLDSGLCIGLLDPVNNIIANAVCTSDVRPETAPVGIIVSKKGCSIEIGMNDLGRRSLEGLVAFLIYFFPYLAEWEAVRYLLLADADLLATACLIVRDRGMTLFSPTSPVAAQAFEEALTLAAQVAKHSQPCRLAQLWMSLSSGLHQAMTMLPKVQSHFPLLKLKAFRAWHRRYRAPADLIVPWDLGASRLNRCNSSSIQSMPYQHTRSLQMLLLDRIHGYYLEALTLLPSGALRSRLHRSLLKAGHCYGPMDPVSNIVLNTIWYDVNFPAAAETIPQLDVIGPSSLTRLVSRSFYGLVSFLQSRYHDLSEHEIVQCLLAASAQLSLADPKLNYCSDADQLKQHHYQYCLECMPSLFGDAIRKVKEASPCADVLEAYAAAATAAWHCHPEEQAKFLSSWDKRDFTMGAINFTDVQFWSTLLYEAQQRAPERVCNPSHRARAGKACSMKMQRRISRKVKAALDRHLIQDGKPMFDLHIICCVNEDVCGPEYSEEVDPLSCAPCKYRYSHVNFMVTKRDFKSDVTMFPELFFAEFDNEEEDSSPVILCKVDWPIPFSEHVRCLYCESEGARVVHPPRLKFHGGGSELEEVIRGERGELTNDRHISKSDYHVQNLYGLPEDFLYVDVSKSVS